MQALVQRRDHLQFRAPAVHVDALHLQDEVGVPELHYSGYPPRAQPLKSITLHPETTIRMRCHALC